MLEEPLFDVKRERVFDLGGRIEICGTDVYLVLIP